MSKKIKKPIKLRKPKNNNQKHQTMKKNRLNFLKNRPVRFQFYKPEIEKIEPNRTQTEKNSLTGKKSS